MGVLNLSRVDIIQYATAVMNFCVFNVLKII